MSWKDVAGMKRFAHTGDIGALDFEQKSRLLANIVRADAYDTLREAFARGLTPNVGDQESRDALFMSAALRASTAVFDFLLVHNFLDYVSFGESFAVGLLVDKHQYEKVWVLLSHKPYLANTLRKKTSILSRAVMRWEAPGVEQLLDMGANPNGVPRQVMTPVMTAIKNQRLVVLQILLSRGADACAVQSAGEDCPPTTPLHVAFVERGSYLTRFQMIDFLIEGGANVYQCGTSPCVCDRFRYVGALADEMYRFACHLTRRAMRRRVVETALGLCALDLPVLCVVGVSEWLMPADRGNPVSMHERWQIASAVQQRAYATTSAALASQE